ncbi:carbohydrate kinase [Rhodohalobacter sp. SW132]|uniref:xylulokinase n=1 Tax=Rhodohalobacter sp. SW132 TaxID=2293433 RepID=UPI000E2362C1|nr:FGGY family carbohydrate kinase [Rhodohalobacter sp. SW132]REL38020.1 carbohydrate kinase [Rhodohalobacter sp. SW132]
MSEKNYLLGYDIGSSSIKTTVIDADTGKAIGSATSPKQEMEMQAVKPGWAEQDPEMWWEHIIKSTHEILEMDKISGDQIRAIGIAYQMHGLVAVDKNKNVLRPSIIWCDSRASKIGEKAFNSLGQELCLKNFLNSPGNFTASKLKWVKENEPELYEQIDKIMLPGDYIAMKLTDKICTTSSGLSEGIFWNFRKNGVATELLDHYGISEDLLPEAMESFGDHGELSAAAAETLGLKEGTKVTYRAGDQPNNAFSLNVLNPGEVAATAGTSGVIYGIIDEPDYDEKSRVNTFVHVNHDKENSRYGVLLCINGTGILNSWLRKNLGVDKSLSYEKMNELASEVPIGSDGVTVLPFGNGNERILQNKDFGASVSGLNFNRHTSSHLLRAAQEGIVFSLYYGFQIMENMGMKIHTVRAGHANMFLSPLFREAFVNTTGARLELYDTDGSQGAARGAGVGAGIYSSTSDAFNGLTKIDVIEPTSQKRKQYLEAYTIWLDELNSKL